MPDDRSFHVIEVRPERLDASPGVPRRRWSAEAKARLVAEAMVPDANVSAIARRNGLSPAQLFGWKRQALERLNVPQSESSLDDRKGTEVDIATDHPVIVEIIIGGITIRAGADIGEEALKRVIRAVRSA